LLTLPCSLPLWSPPFPPFRPFLRIESFLFSFSPPFFPPNALPSLFPQSALQAMRPRNRIVHLSILSPRTLFFCSLVFSSENPQPPFQSGSDPGVASSSTLVLRTKFPIHLHYPLLSNSPSRPATTQIALPVPPLSDNLILFSPPWMRSFLKFGLISQREKRSLGKDFLIFFPPPSSFPPPGYFFSFPETFFVHARVRV